MKCVGNCIKCDLVSDQEKVTCCVFQILRQDIEIRSQLKIILEKINSMSEPPIFDDVSELVSAEIEVDGQDGQVNNTKKKKK